MERYAHHQDLAPRDMVHAPCTSRSVREGAGPTKDYIHLDLTHIDSHVIEERLPDITEFARIYLGVDPVKELVPIQPTAHYAMGGIPTTIDTNVILDGNNTVLPGLYAAGEVACASLHGANRLGTNSLGDLLVFGRRAGRNGSKYAETAQFGRSQRGWTCHGAHRHAMNGPHTERVSHLRKELQRTMMDNASVFRTQETLSTQRDELKQLRERYKNIGVEDKASGSTQSSWGYRAGLHAR